MTGSGNAPPADRDGPPRAVRPTSLKAMVAGSARPSEEDGSAAGRALGDYRLIRRLGAGGMGTVWEAEQVSLGRRVALKLLAPQLSLSEDTVARFRREAAAGGRLSHSGIVAVHEVGEVDGTHFITQELVPGGFTLDDFLAGVAERDELPTGYFRAVAELFAKVADALQAAHEAGVIHRDVKPGNILIDEDDEPKLADFGLAQINDDLVRSRTLELAGTPFYMSPEQAMSKAMGLDARTDVFSLGATLYEALTLRRAFEGDTSQQVLEQIVLVDPPEPRRLRSKVPPDLSVICSKAMEKRRQDRYATMAEFAADLRRHLADEPIHARPPGPVTRSIKWTRRHPVMSVAGTVAAVALLIVSVLLVNLRDRNKELTDALHQGDIALGFLDLLARQAAAGDTEDHDRRETEPGMELEALLAQGQELVDEGLSDRPLLREVLERTLANVYLERNDTARAEALYKAATLRHLADRGEADPVTLASMEILREFYHDIERHAEAAEWAERCVEAAVRVHGADDPATEVFFQELAHHTAHAGSPEDVLAFRRRIAALAARAFGEAATETVQAVMHVGSSLYETGRPDEAERELRRAIRLAEQTDDDGAASLLVRHRLGDLLKDLGRYEEALVAYPLEDTRRLHGDGSEETIEAMNDVARIYRLLGRHEESEQLFLETIALAEERLGTVAWRTPASQGELAQLYVDQQRYDEAAELLEQAVARMAEGFGQLHQVTQAQRARLRDVYLLQGRAEEAAKLDALLAQIPRHAWSPLQATGEPDSFSGEDTMTAWAPMEPNAGDEWLEVDFDPPLAAHTVHIHESHSAGATVEVVLIDASGEEVGRIPVPDLPRKAPTVVEVAFPSPGTPVRTVRIVLDTRRVVGWNEIDAVELVGPDARAWAVAARASSYYMN